MPNDSRHVPAGRGDIYAFDEHIFRFLSTAEDTGGSYSAMEIISPQDSGPGPHTHDEAEEFFLLLDGQVVFHVGQETFTVNPGDFVHVPRGVVHQFKVVTPKSRMVAAYAPGGVEQWFIDAGTPLSTSQVGPHEHPPSEGENIAAELDS